jgi:tetratricopeptide (TPR) repeat protein
VRALVNARTSIGVRTSSVTADGNSAIPPIQSAGDNVSMDAREEDDSNRVFIERFLPRFSGVLAELELPTLPPPVRKADTGAAQQQTIPGWSSGPALVNQLRLVARRLPSSASAALHVGLCYLRMGDRKAARSWLELAVQRLGGENTHALDFTVRHALWVASRGLTPFERQSGIGYWDCSVEEEKAWLDPNPATRAVRLRDLVERRCDDADLWNNLGVALVREERYLSAAACLEQAALRGNVAPALVNYAQLMALAPFSCTKQEIERRELLQLQRSSALASVTLLEAICGAQIESFNSVEAESFDTSLLAFHSFAWSGLALWHSLRNEHLLAHASACVAVALAPEEFQAEFSLLARILTTHADLSRSIPRTLEHAERLRRAASHLKQLSERVGRSTALLHAAQVAMGLCARLRSECGDEHGHSRLTDSSARHYSLALERNPDDASNWMSLALLLVDIGEYTDAVDLLLQAWDRDRGNPLTLNNVGIVLGLANRPEEGCHALWRALQSAWALPCPALHSTMWNNLGSLYRQKKQFEEALRCYKQALAIGGEQPSVYNNLGVLLLMMDAHLEAKEMFTRALELDERYDCARSNRCRVDELVQWRKQLSDMAIL